MATAFQSSAFQNNGFQIVVAPATVAGGAPYAVDFTYKKFEDLIRELAAAEKAKKKAEKQLEKAVEEYKPLEKVVIRLDELQGRIDQLKAAILAATSAERFYTQSRQLSAAMRRRVEEILTEDEEDILFLL